jgi:hypothetical protein
VVAASAAGYISDDEEIEDHHYIDINDPRPIAFVSLQLNSQVNQVTVTFDANGGTLAPGGAARTLDSGQSLGIAMPNNPTLASHSFNGWNTMQNGSGTPFTSATVVNSNMTVFAQWIFIGGGGGGNGGGNGGGPGPGGTIIDEPETPRDESPFVSAHIWYVRGFEDGRFLADRSITRAEVAMIIWRLLDSNNKHLQQPSRFNDVANNSWYAQAVNYLATRNILRGFEDGSFRPNQPISRAELTAVMSRFFDMDEHGQISFTDVSNTHWAFAYIVNAHNKGWVTGYNNQFRPNDATTRAETVTIINRVLNRVPNPETIRYNLDDLRVFSDLADTHWAFYQIMEAAIEHDFYLDEDGREIWTNIFIPGLH